MCTLYARVQNYLEWIKQLTADGECKTGSTSVTTAAPSATTAATTTATTKTSTAATNDDYSYYNYEG